MRFLLLIFIQLISFSLIGQYDTIRVKNGSFEDRPRAGSYVSPTIKSWYDCGAVQFPNESAPDIHPVDFWQVSLPAQEGNTYLGMVVRDNDSWESVSQRLTKPINSGSCYSFSVNLARSSKYLSGSRKLPGNVEVQYTRPAVLRVWGSNGYCGKRELIAESRPVQNYNWQTYEFKFKARNSHLFITIEAFYKTPVLVPYNGHILVDGLSNLEEVPCKGEEVIAKVEQPKPEPRRTKVVKPEPEEKEEPVVTAVEVVKPKPQPRKPKIKKINGLTKRDLKEGQVLQIKNLLFGADKSTINRSSFEALNKVYEFLAENEEIKIEIGGHTNGRKGITHEFCDKLSFDRAKTVADFFIEKGLDPERLTYKGYGKRQPIASNKTNTGRRKNQRVEIKIMSLG